MKDLAAFLLVGALFFQAGCTLFESGEEDGPSAVLKQVTAGESFTIEEDQRVTLPALSATLHFIKREQDSRCPTDVTCVWEGEVDLRFSFALDSQSPTEFLLTGFVGPEGKERVVLDTLAHRFTLSRLDPYPKDDAPNNGPVIATMSVDALSN